MPIAGLAGIALAAVLVFVAHEVPYLATRPPESAKFADLSTNVQRVDARLWQDPFSAVEDFEQREIARRGFDSKAEELTGGTVFHGAKTKSGERAFDSARFGVTLEDFKKLFPKPAKPVSEGSGPDSRPPRALPVLISGSHFVGAEEARRRTRYAVLAALDELGYAPIDGDHIGYVMVPVDKVVDKASPGSPTVRVPFETYQATWAGHRGADAEEAAAFPTKVIVLWVDDSALSAPDLKGSTWLNALANVLQNLGVCPGAQESGRQNALKELPGCDVPVIGPSSSDRYRDLVDGLDSPEKLPLLSLHYLVSPFVTSNLLEDRATLSQLQKRGLTVLPTIVSDSKVIEALLDELSFRRVPLCVSSRNILLVGEWDTEYGRRARDTFRDELADTCHRRTERDDEHAKILSFSFVRGLDGVAINTSDKSDKSTSQPATSPTSAFEGTEAQIEWPENPDQRDYLRRIGQQLSQLSLSRNIVAVGILATDTHDKLLFLQALRGLFPRAVFFTTDVDARYIHPLVREWTRNLIIAGGYGLALRHDVQARTPPFRDGYQTATFLAASLALQLPADSRRPVDWGFLSKQPVQLYEVGRTHLVRLLPDSGESIARPQCKLSALSACPGNLQPQHRVALRGKRERLALGLLWIVSAVAMLAWGLRRTERDISHWTAAARIMSDVFLGGLVLSLIVFAWLLLQVAYPGIPLNPPEPQLFAEGISSWPIALLWCFALALTFMFLLRILRTAGPRLDATRAKFAGDWTEDSQDRINPCWDWLDWLKSSLFVPRPTSALGSSTRMLFTQIWARYQRQARGWPRVLRIFAIWIVLFLGPFLLVHGTDLLQPPPVIRGPFHTTVWLLDISHFLLLTFLMSGVADGAILCTLFVLDVGRQRNTYPDSVLQATCARLGLCEELKPYLDEYLDCDVIGERTAAVARYLYYPFIVLAVLAIAMTSLFDDWVFSLARVGLYAFYVGVLLLLWLGLHRAATRARTIALAEMELIWIDLQRNRDRDSKVAEAMRRQFPLLVVHVKSLKVGAYGPLLAQPIFRALLWPLGTVSSTQLVQYLFLR